MRAVFLRARTAAPSSSSTSPWCSALRHPWLRAGFLRSSSTFQRRLGQQQIPRVSSSSSSSHSLRVAVCLGSLTAFALALTAPLEGAAEDERDVAAPVKSTEELMLEESERERWDRHKTPRDRLLVHRALRRALLFVIDYIVEPVATGFRFVTLVAIFAPVILTIPLIYVGERVGDRSGERAGTLWWYSFLLRSLERAGPTFIKVREHAAAAGCGLLSGRSESFS